MCKNVTVKNEFLVKKSPQLTVVGIGTYCHTVILVVQSYRSLTSYSK